MASLNVETPTKMTRAKKRPHHCGVPQCNSLKISGISLHKIPKRVACDRKELLKWKVVLKMGKPIPKTFQICSKHFKKGQIIYPIARGQQVQGKLVDSAFPSLLLPKSCVAAKKQAIEKIKARYIRMKRRNLVNTR